MVLLKEAKEVTQEARSIDQLRAQCSCRAKEAYFNQI